MIYSGQDIFKYLSIEAEKEDPGESSHWENYNKNLKFNNDNFEGVYGFGSDAGPYTGIKKLLHSIMQSKYRKIGRNFPSFPEVSFRAKAIADKQQRAYSLDVLRQTLTVSFLSQYFNFETNSKKINACVIGDGFATMTSLLHSCEGVNLTIMINLTKTLMVDLWYLKKNLGDNVFEKKVKVVTDKNSLEEVLSSKEDNLVVAFQAKHSHLLEYCPINLAINIASMQEMHPDVVADYFLYLRKVSKENELSFYCCNREEKILPGGEIVRFMEYPWQNKDEVKVDELCPWHQQYYVLKPPRYMNYDGPVRHRLVKLSQVI